MGPGYQFTSRQCKHCGHIGHYVGRDGWWCCLISPQSLNEIALEYINTTMIRQARAYKELWEAVNSAKTQILYDDLLTQWDLDPVKGCVHHYLAGEYTPEGKAYTRSNFEYRDLAGNRLPVDHLALEAAISQMYDENPDRPDVVYAPDPINLPAGVTAFVSRKGKWEAAKPLVGKLPRDPVRVRHDRFYSEVFKAVQDSLGLTFTTTERANGYYSDKFLSEPWYDFEVAGITFTVGPRKRVTHISFKAPAPVGYAQLQALAKRDNVTFEVKPPWEDAAQALLQAIDKEADNWIDQVQAAAYKAEDEYQGDKGKSTEVLIHAWDKDKAIEYLTTAIAMLDIQKEQAHGLDRT